MPPVAAEPPPPEAEALLALGADDWAALLSQVRAALQALDDAELDPVLRRFRDAPVSRLVGGDARRELAHRLGAGGTLWTALSRRISEGSSPAGLRRLVRPEPAAARRDDPAPGTEAPVGDAAHDRLERARERARQLMAERDEARRRLTGAEARLAAAEQEHAATRRALAELRTERDELVGRLTTADEERRRAVDREQRRWAARIDELEDELRVLRRSEERRREEARRRERRPPPAAEGPPADAATRPADAPGGPPPVAAGLHPGSREYADALLVPGRPVLVDGYNVTRTHRADDDLLRQRSWLVGQASALAARRGLDLTVVFDGGQGDHRAFRQPREITVVFSARGLTADDEIDFRVAALPPEAPVVVVTDDRELRDRVRSLGADVLATAPFVAVLG